MYGGLRDTDQYVAQWIVTLLVTLFTSLYAVAITHERIGWFHWKNTRHEKVILLTPRMPSRSSFCFFHSFLIDFLIEEANDLAGDVLAAGLFVVHDAGRGCQHDVAELTGGQQLDDPLLKVGQADVVAGGDDTSLVEAVQTELAGTYEVWTNS
jgi:hypothetical protein